MRIESTGPFCNTSTPWKPVTDAGHSCCSVVIRTLTEWNTDAVHNISAQSDLSDPEKQLFPFNPASYGWPHPPLQPFFRNLSCSLINQTHFCSTRMDWCVVTILLSKYSFVQEDLWMRRMDAISSCGYFMDKSETVNQNAAVVMNNRSTRP